MKKQSFISAFALVLLSVFAFSCEQDEFLPTVAETAIVQNEETIDASKVFPLPEKLQALSEEELIAHLKTLTKEDMDKMAADYAAQNPVSERSSAAIECMFCALAVHPAYHPNDYLIPGFFILMNPMQMYASFGCNYCSAAFQYYAVAL